MGLGGILALSHLVSRRSVRAGFALELIAIFSMWHMCEKKCYWGWGPSITIYIPPRPLSYSLISRGRVVLSAPIFWGSYNHSLDSRGLLVSYTIFVHPQYQNSFSSGLMLHWSINVGTLTTRYAIGPQLWHCTCQAFFSIRLGSPTHIIRNRIFTCSLVATSDSTSTKLVLPVFFDYQIAIFPYSSSAPPRFIRQGLIYFQVFDIMTSLTRSLLK